MLGHLVHIVVEESAVGDDSVGGQRLDTGTGCERRERLVESDVAVGADTAEEEVYATGFLNHALIVGALSLQILGVAVQDMDVLGRAAWSPKTCPLMW